MALGDLLAIRGLPTVNAKKTSKYLYLVGLMWFAIGLMFFFIDEKMILIWSLMTTWLGLVSLASKQEISA
jgi:hypothetical protein